MAERGVKCRASGKWTEAKYFGFIRNALRNANKRYPPRFEALAKAKHKVDWGRIKTAYKCAKCKQLFSAKEVEVDHIVPAGSLKCYADLPSFVERMFCEVDGLQVLCKSCHKDKTAAERKARSSK